MFCQCTLDACLDSALECMLFNDPRDGLTRPALGAYEHGELLEISYCVIHRLGVEMPDIPVCT
jgi:hypothetical protein